MSVDRGKKMTSIADLERVIRPLTRRFNGQYPRPWHTDQTDPTTCRVFLIGRNWGAPFYVKKVGTHRRFIDAHFNRNGESCVDLYNEVTGHSPTLTKQAYKPLLDALSERGICDTLETNVICYGTEGSSIVLNNPEHRGGKQRGIEIFRTVVEMIKPPVMICHGVGTAKDFKKIWNCEVPDPRNKKHDPEPLERSVADYYPTIFVIPSLGAPQVNKWDSWRPAYCESLAELIRDRLASL